jgi:hypothetical protein
MTSKDLLKVSLVLTIVASAGAAYASANITASTMIGNGSFTPSANVTLSVASGNTSYAATAQHLNGDRVFFGTNTDPKIYYTTKATGTTTALSGLASTTVAPTSNWSTL